MQKTVKRRPRFLALHEIRLPVAGFVSILHRVSGAGLFLFLPLLIYLFDLSLKSPDSFEQLQSCISHPVLKLILFGLIWAFLHHFCAGIRFLLLDLHVGIEKQQSQTSAKLVLAVSLGLSIIVAIKFLGVPG